MKRSLRGNEGKLVERRELKGAESVNGELNGVEGDAGGGEVDVIMAHYFRGAEDFFFLFCLC